MDKANDAKVPPTEVVRVSDRAVEVRRRFAAPPRIVFTAWTQAELMRRWWVPQSFGMTLVACEIDARTGGGYRLEFAVEGGTMAFHGRYLEVTPPERLVWTNEEEPDGAVTSVTFAARDGGTLLTLREDYPSPEALERSYGSTEGLPEQFAQLDALLVTL